MATDLQKNPLVSFCIFTYNQEKYIAEAISGALSQTYDNMEIIISDDHSSDSTWTVINDTISNYTGTKHIVLNRNERNLRLVPHVNHVIQIIAKGDIVMLAGGDDVSMPNRVADTVKEYIKHPSAMAVCGQAIDIDKDGNLLEKDIECRPFKIWKLDDEYIKSLSFMVGVAALSIKRSIYDKYGPLQPQTPTEDSTLRFRALLSGNVVESDKNFLYYRIHDNQLSGAANVYKLKTNNIAKQYKIDIRKAYTLGLIDRKLYHRLLRKVLLYQCDRNLAAHKQKLPRVLRAPFKLLQTIDRKLVQWV